MTHEDPRWTGRRQILGCLTGVVLAALVMGARGVTDEVRQRPADRRRVADRVRTWSVRMVRAVPVSENASWAQVAREEAEFLVRVCAVERREYAAGGAGDAVFH